MSDPLTICRSILEVCNALSRLYQFMCDCSEVYDDTRDLKAEYISGRLNTKGTIMVNVELCLLLRTRIEQVEIITKKLEEKSTHPVLMGNAKNLTVLIVHLKAAEKFIEDSIRKAPEGYETMNKAARAKHWSKTKAWVIGKFRERKKRKEEFGSILGGIDFTVGLLNAQFILDTHDKIEQQVEEDAKRMAQKQIDDAGEEKTLEVLKRVAHENQETLAWLGGELKIIESNMASIVDTVSVTDEKVTGVAADVKKVQRNVKQLAQAWEQMSNKVKASNKKIVTEKVEEVKEKIDSKVEEVKDKLDEMKIGIDEKLHEKLEDMKGHMENKMLELFTRITNSFAERTSAVRTRRTSFTSNTGWMNTRETKQFSENSGAPRLYRAQSAKFIPIAEDREDKSMTITPIKVNHSPSHSGHQHPHNARYQSQTLPTSPPAPHRDHIKQFLLQGGFWTDHLTEESQAATLRALLDAMCVILNHQPQLLTSSAAAPSAASPSRPPVQQQQQQQQ